MATTALEILRIKARAFDNLMSIMQDKHEFVRRYTAIIDKPPVELGKMTNNAVMRTKEMRVYEWRIQVLNDTDLRGCLMDKAAKDLKKST